MDSREFMHVFPVVCASSCLISLQPKQGWVKFHTHSRHMTGVGVGGNTATASIAILCYCMPKFHDIPWASLLLLPFG